MTRAPASRRPVALPSGRLLSGMLAALAMVVALLALEAAGDAEAADRARCARHQADFEARAAMVTGHGPEVVVIGDSWAVGLGLSQPRSSWPSRLEGEVHVAGFSGSGFSVGASRCGDVSYAARAPHAVPRGTDLVVVEGGLNDHNQREQAVVDGFTDLVAVLRDRGVGRIVVVGPAPAPSRADEVPRLDRLLAGLAARHDVAYVSAADWELPYLPDGLHLTAEGHQLFGDRVAAALARLTTQPA